MCRSLYGSDRHTPEICLRALIHALPLVLFAGVTSATAVAGQYTLPLVSTDPIDLSAFDLSGSDQIRRGRVSVVYAQEGIRLVTYYLRSDPVAPRITYPDPTPAPTPSAAPSVQTRQTALWVWNTAELLVRPDERATFLDFIEAQGITRVFLYLPAAQGERPQSGFIPFSSHEMGPLLGELSTRGARAYALDGDRYYVLEENHAGVFRTVRRIVAHNQSVPEEQRFHGVRYDIEPYLVPGFQGPLRQSLLDGYVQLVAGASDIARANGLAVAVDIPFWFDAPDEESGLYMEAELNGERAPILEHIMRLVDDVAIMDYRTAALGPNGAVVHAQRELELGEKMGVDVFVGVETVDLPDEDLLTFSGPVGEGLPPHAQARWLVLEEDAESVTRLWVVDGEEALEELTERARDSRLVRHWPAGRPIRVAADIQSFHHLGADQMRAVTDDITRHLVTWPAFVGLAYHEYRTMLEILGRN